MKNLKVMIIEKPVSTPPVNCARCRRKIDRATGIDAKQPEEGSISICGYCGLMSLYTADLKLRAPTREELADIKRAAPEAFELAERLSGYFAARRAGREN